MIFAALPLLVSGCDGRVVKREQESTPSKVILYETVLGKPVNDAVVIDFITSNHCSSIDHFQFCKAVGMALWIDSKQIVETGLSRM